jgi:hypothetical protein
VDELRAGQLDRLDPEALFRFCLPYDHPEAPVRVSRPAGNAWVFVSPSTDFRFLGASLLRSDQIVGHQSTGALAGVVGLEVGYGSNFLNAIEVNGRLVLNNGSHRAYALYASGVHEAPCLIQTVSRMEELELVASGDLVGSPDRYLAATRPPLLKDYFDPELRVIHHRPRNDRMIKVTFGVEQLEVPA